MEKEIYEDQIGLKYSVIRNGSKVIIQCEKYPEIKAEFSQQGFESAISSGLLTKCEDPACEDPNKT